MGGWKMVAARRAVARMIETLLPQDRFQIYAFDDHLVPLTGNLQLVEATPRRRTQAVEFVGGIESRGGTEMADPLDKAVAELLRDDDKSRDRVLVLITDGQVGNEDQILKHLGRRLKKIRVFALGIDMAVNAGFLNRLAEQGGGSCELVESESRLDEVMTSIHRRLGQPVLSALELRSAGLEVLPGSLVPERLPDVFPGAPVQILGRYHGSPTGGVELVARDADGSPWQCEVAPLTSDSPAVTHVWARGQVRALEDRYAMGGADARALERRIVATSLRFGVLSRFTAYITVDRTEVVNEGGAVKQVVQPVETPEGWQAPAAAPCKAKARRRLFTRGVPESSPPPATAKPESTGQDRFFELSLGESDGLVPPKGDSDDEVFATDFEVPGLDDESASEARALDEGTDLESSDFDLVLSDDDMAAEDESKSQVVALEDDAGGGTDFADILLREQVISPEQLADARALERSTGMKLQDALLKSGYATSEEIMSALAEQHGVQHVDLTGIDIPPAIVELIPESVARENVVLPLAQEGWTLKVVMIDPSDFDTVQKLQFILNKDIQPVLASREQIVEAIQRHYGECETGSVDSMLAEFTDTAIDFTQSEAEQIYDAPPTSGRILGVSGVSGESLRESSAADSGADAPVVKLVNLIIQEAINLRATEIHIEPFPDRVRIRYRIKGKLVERDNPPRRLLAPILARLKIMASLDVAEEKQPQDGSVKMKLNGRHYELRLRIVPTVHGQSAVVHILELADEEN
jgi:hypothetical protein